MACRYAISHCDAPPSEQLHSAEEANERQTEIRGERTEGPNEEDRILTEAARSRRGGLEGGKGSYLSNLSQDHQPSLRTSRVESQVVCAGPCQALTVI